MYFELYGHINQYVFVRCTLRSVEVAFPVRAHFPWVLSPIFNAPNEKRSTPRGRVGICQKSHRYGQKGTASPNASPVLVHI